MTKLFNYIKVRIVITIISMAIFASCNEGGSLPTTKKDQAITDTVKAFRVKTDSAQKTILLPGDLLPDENVQVRAKVQGYISSVKIDIGARVHKGQVLALIDAPEINTRVQELVAKEKAAQARYESSKDYYERITTASKSDGVIAQSELERTKNQMQADQAEYNAAKFAVLSNKQIGNYLAIVAPYAGIITKRNINAGSFVGNTGEKPLFEIEDDKILRLRVAVPEVYTNAELTGNTGELTTRSVPDKKFIAKLVRKSGTIDNASRSETWEFEIPNPSGELKAGSFADVKLHFLRSKQSLVVPSSAIVSTLEKRFVIKVTNDTTQWIDVRPGFTMNDKQELFGEIKPGDTLIMKANEEIKPGKNVIVSLFK
ncbi:MAG TPA: efflux RND transporter periplasmic adaptor subunit [Chitinophagaceae bacterium]|jgi:membrane fusion protein, multidrug efflux system|nr:efflux RND transporter periplasmic adaptor subunit [Chitinophagaceae bacterium]